MAAVVKAAGQKIVGKSEVEEIKNSVALGNEEARIENINFLGSDNEDEEDYDVKGDNSNNNKHQKKWH